MSVILNIAGGKFDPIGVEKLKSVFLVNLDRMYYSSHKPEEIEDIYQNWLVNKKPEPVKLFCTADAFEFLSRSKITFDKITIYRFLEHVKKTDVLYFIYLLSTAVKKGGTVEVIVPNYKVLAERILKENVNAPNFEAEDIITTFELLNEPNEPHASIWTVDRAKHFFELEGRFTVQAASVDEQFMFDGRDIYLYFEAVRVK